VNARSSKVLVVRRGAQAIKVLTGSTNFAVSGLYINSNHVLVFEDSATPAQYAEVFQAVWDGNVTAAAFLASPLSARRYLPPGDGIPPCTITFSPHTEEDATGLLDAIAARVAAEGERHDATASVLFAVMGLKGIGAVYPALKVPADR
jgi:hypothetical protein